MTEEDRLPKYLNPRTDATSRSAESEADKYLSLKQILKVLEPKNKTQSENRCIK